MQTHELVAHPAYPPSAIRRVEARILSIGDTWVRLRWRIDGVEKLVIPKFAGKGRADELWRTTCFELFMQPPAAMGTANSTCPRRSAGRLTISPGIATG